MMSPTDGNPSESGDKKKKNRRPAKTVSRRDFLKKSTLGTGVVAASAGASEAVAAGQDGDTGITIAKDFTKSLDAPPRPATFEGSGRRRGMTGASVFAKVCQQEGLAALFCCPGNYAVINALAAEGIPCYGGRTEGMMCAAADAFIRVTGEIAATSGTEGPGFTNMIMNVAAANAARTPLLVPESAIQ